jgi:transcriptional regulator with XRE-family HTH domain
LNLSRAAGGQSEAERTGFKEEGTMRNEERLLARRKLDRELRFYRLAAKEKNPTQDVLRAVRQALGIPMGEIARALKTNPSVIFRLERSQTRETISVRSMGRVAEAMGCKVVYALVPRGGETLEELAERRWWKKELGTRDQGLGTEGLGTRD